MTIYALTEPGGEIRYIGKTGQPLEKRLSQHLEYARGGRRTHTSCWIRSLLKDGTRPVIRVLETCEGNGCTEEIRLIADGRANGLRLTNGTRGGDGLVDPTAEVRARMSAAMKGRIIPQKTRDAVSARHKGTKHTPEQCEKMRQKMLGRFVSQEWRQNMSVAKKKEFAAMRAAGIKSPSARFTPLEEQAICDEYRAGGRTKEIARNRGVKWTLIYEVLTRGHIEFRPHSLTAEQAAKCGLSKRGKKLSPEHLKVKNAAFRAAMDAKNRERDMKMIAEFKNGLNIKQIGHVHDVHKDTVTNVLKKHGVTKHVATSDLLFAIAT